MTHDDLIRLRENIPAELQAMKRFVVWRRQNRKKIPFQVSNPSQPANVHDHNTWSGFPAMLKVLENDLNNSLGAGFVLGEDIVGLDLDGVLNNKGDLVNEEAAQLLDALPGYLEISPSERGLHLLIRGSLPKEKDRIRLGPFEFYDKKSPRFLTITGNVYKARHDLNLHDASEEIERIYWRMRNLYPKPPRPEPLCDLQEETALHFESNDEEILELARKAANGEKFETLFDKGDTSNYPSQSEAVAALLILLAFWTEKNETQIDRLFRQSALFPCWAEKWSRLSTVEITKACKLCNVVYSPQNGVRGTNRPIATYNTQQREKLLHQYGFTVITVLDELLFGVLRRNGCCGLARIRDLDKEVAEVTDIPLADVQIMLKMLENDGLLFRHHKSHYVIFIEYWSHNTLDNINILKSLQTAIRNIPLEAGAETFLILSEILEGIAAELRSGYARFQGSRASSCEQMAKRANFFDEAAHTARERLKAFREPLRKPFSEPVADPSPKGVLE